MNGEENMTRIAFVDDHTLVRTGLVGLLNHLPGYRVVLEADNGVHLQQLLTPEHDVQLAIVDLNMPVMDGFATLKWLTQEHPAIRCLALTFDGSEGAVINAVLAGARGYLLKDVKPEVFKLALDCVRDTGYYQNELVSPASLKRTHTLYDGELAQRKLVDAIPEREREFIRTACIRPDTPYEDLGEFMGVKPSTINEYRKRIYERFGIRSRAGLVIFAYRWGIVSLAR